MSNYIPHTIAQIRQDFAKGKSPVSLVQECLDRIAAGNATTRAMIFVDREGALEAARRAKKALRSGMDLGLLHGIPVAVKDVIDVQGWPTTSGSKIYEGHIAARDANCIENLRKAGAIIVGKTNLHELTAGNHENPWFGQVVNPLDPSRGTGGTSSGSAAAVAAGYCVASLGTDTGGSNRSTAAATGLFGYKPSRGLIDYHGTRPTAPSLDTIGPIANSVEDARLIHYAMLGEVPPAREPALASELRVGLCKELYAASVDPVVADAHDVWLDWLGKAGVSIINLEFPKAAQVKEAGITILSFEFAREYRAVIETDPTKVGSAVHAFLALGVAVEENSYRDAVSFRDEATQEFLALMSTVDVLATPVTPGLAPRLSDEQTRVGATFTPYGLAGGSFRRWANFFGVPTLAMPLASGERLPASIQISAPPGEDGRLFSICETLFAIGFQPDAHSKLQRKP